MPLKDQSKFRDTVQWSSFHQNWAVKMVDRLNETVLPDRYRSDSHAHLGKRVEIDVATFEHREHDDLFASANGGGLAVETKVYAPPAPPLAGTVSFADGDTFEVKIRQGQWDLVAAIELVSPSNKDRDDTRTIFVGKCASYLAAGVSVVVIDVVTERLADLHLDLCDRLDLSDSFHWKSPTGLSAVCYRTTQGRLKPDLAIGDGVVRLNVWPYQLSIGSDLPTVPLWLAGDLAVPLELELTYAAVCKSLRIR